MCRAMFDAQVTSITADSGSVVQQALPLNSSAARLAQSVERETLNLKVAGSTPASGSIPDATSQKGAFLLLPFFGFFSLCFPRASSCLCFRE
ncbi:hypothetical protein BR93DRAFT_70168 [Coniochaeta sp. PMI_546]|nr:hypothetical protein BR93DRAFT_70168 [Coniochaeta sp. PMI_546]